MTIAQALRVIVDVEPGKELKYWAEIEKPGSTINFSYANLESQTPIHVEFGYLDSRGTKNVLFSFDENSKELDEGHLAANAGWYELAINSTQKTQVEFDLSIDDHASLNEEDVVEEETGVGSLKDTLNRLKKELQEMLGRIKQIKMRENRSMITVETVEARIMKFSIFEVLLMVILPFGSVYVLKNYFQNHLKKGVA